MKTVLITGAGGSLGKEFVKFLLKEKHNVIALENNEWAVTEIREEFPQALVVLKDFSKWKFNQNPCDVVIHCAAYKHVSLGEENPHDFIENNVNKTGKLFAEAYKHNADIVFISTDKAVEPISTYGFTKALGEKLCFHYGGIVVRLGNILDSSGSVIPVWEKAIKKGEKIKITDFEMTRYVIEGFRAVRFIWEAYLEKKTRLIVPHMGKPISLYDLLLKVLAKHKMMDKAVNIAEICNVVGARPGEKKHEKLRWDYEL